MEFLKISKNYLNFLVEQLFFLFLSTQLSATVSGLKKMDFYLKDDEVAVETSRGFPPLFTGNWSLLNRHKLPEVSE